RGRGAQRGAHHGRARPRSRARGVVRARPDRHAELRGEQRSAGGGGAAPRVDRALRGRDGAVRAAGRRGRTRALERVRAPPPRGLARGAGARGRARVPGGPRHPDRARPARGARAPGRRGADAGALLPGRRVTARPAPAASSADAPTVVRSVYVHAPFCARRCVYCDFAVKVRAGGGGRDWLEALGRELEHVRREGLFALDERLATLYVGGGTPSMLEAEAMSGLAALLGPERLSAAEIELSVQDNRVRFFPE